MFKAIGIKAVLVSAFTLSLASQAIACVQEKNDRTLIGAALNCSAAFQILNSVSAVNPPLGNYFKEQGEFSDRLWGIYTQAETGKKPSREQSRLARDYIMRKHDLSFQLCPSFAHKLVENCIGWTHSLALHLEAKANNQTSAKKVDKILLQGPRPNVAYTYPHGEFHEMKPILDAGYAEWVRSGKPKPLDLAKELNKSKAKKKEFS